MHSKHEHWSGPYKNDCNRHATSNHCGGHRISVAGAFAWFSVPAALQKTHNKKFATWYVQNPCRGDKAGTLQISHVALTSDLWTSRTTKSYLTITCYFVTSTWEHESLVLETFGFKNDHTAQNIAASFQKIAEEWGISREVVAMVTDNAANVVAAVRHTGWTHVPCFAHTLNLVISEAIKADTKIHQLRKSCRDIVSFFHHSVKASEKLKEIRTAAGNSWEQIHPRSGNQMELNLLHVWTHHGATSSHYHSTLSLWS